MREQDASRCTPESNRSWLRVKTTAAYEFTQPKLAIGLRDKHASNGIRSVAFLSERKRQFTEPSLNSIHFDVRELLTVHTRRALVGAALRISMSQDIVTADLVVQGIEAIPGFCLRFRVQRHLQLLNTRRSC